MVAQICPLCGDRSFFAQGYGYGRDVSCTTCGYVDENLTNAINLHDTVDGYTVGNDFVAYGHSGSKKERDRQAAEKAFKVSIRFSIYKRGKRAERQSSIEQQIITWLFGRQNILGVDQSADLGSPEPSNPLVKSILGTYFQIRYAETLRPDGTGQIFQETVNPRARKVYYQLAVAVRIALAQNNMILVHNALGGLADETFPAEYKLERAVTREILPLPTFREMAYNSAPSNPADTHPLENVKYLYQTAKKYSRYLKRPSDPLYNTMANCSLIIKRLRAIIDAPDAKARRALLAPVRSADAFRNWRNVDFDYFRQPVLAHSWDKVLPLAYNLYRTQQCVFLWKAKSSYTHAIALTLTAVVGIVGTIYPYVLPITADLAAQVGIGVQCPASHYNELRRLIVAWTTSLPDIDIAVPALNLPSRGLVGDGLSGWSGDHRRGVPEAEVHAVSIEPVARHWKELYRARLRMRNDAIMYEEESDIAKKLFARNTPDFRQKSRARAGCSPHAVLLQKYADERAALEREGLPTSMDAPTPGSSSGWEIDDDPEVWFDAGPSVSNEAPDPDWYPTVLNMDHASDPTMLGPVIPHGLQEQYRALERRRERDEIDDLLRLDDTSDEEDGWSSDDEDEAMSTARRFKRKDYAGFGGFTIGPSGLVRERMDIPTELEVELGGYDSPPIMRRCTSEASDSDSVSDLLRPILPFDRPVDPMRKRSASPAVSVSTLHSLGSALPGPGGSLPMSRCSTPSTIAADDDFLIPLVKSTKIDWTPKASRTISDLDPSKAHIAVLIRERDEYILFSESSQRDVGRLVPKDIEQYLMGWLQKERRKGRIPRKITPAYLAAIGLKKDPAVDNISDWILSQQWRWSPLECVLRAGIPPRELPIWMVPHSKLAVVRDLEHHRPLPTQIAIPECPPIPDALKAEPQKFAREIRTIENEWAKDTENGFPVFFPTHEKFLLTAEADVLFEDGEIDMYMATKEEVAERKRDKDFMRLVDVPDRGPSEKTKKEPRVRGRKKQPERIDYNKFSVEFQGYEQALEDDVWSGTGIFTGMEDQEDEEGIAEDEGGFDVWDDKDDESVSVASSRKRKAGSEVSDAERGRKRGRYGESALGMEERRSISNTPVPTTPSTSLISVDFPSVSPSPLLAGFFPCASLEVGDERWTREPSPVSVVDPVPSISVERVREVTPITSLPPTTRPAGQLKRSHQRKTPAILVSAKVRRGEVPSVVAQRGESLVTRQATAIQREVFRVQVKYYKNRIKKVESRATLDLDTMRQLAELHDEKQAVEEKLNRAKDQSRMTKPDMEMVEAAIKSWAAEKRIGLRDLGWSTAAMGIMQIQKKA